MDYGGSIQQKTFRKVYFGKKSLKEKTNIFFQGKYNVLFTCHYVFKYLTIQATLYFKNLSSIGNLH